MILNLKKILAIITIIFLTNYSESLAQSIQWNNDESGFYRIKNNELILHSTNGDKEIVIISKKDLSPINSTPLKLKGYQFSIDRNKVFKEAHAKEAEEGLAKLKQVAREGGNLFEVMMDIVEHCTVGQVTQALFETGGKFRRNM